MARGRRIIKIPRLEAISLRNVASRDKLPSARTASDTTSALLQNRYDNISIDYFNIVSSVRYNQATNKWERISYMRGSRVEMQIIH
jgi:hypothetical protein